MAYRSNRDPGAGALPVAGPRPARPLVLAAPASRQGREAPGNPSGRFEAQSRVAAHAEWDFADTGWPGDEDADLPPLHTTVTRDSARSVLTRNDSPDVPFDQSVNPYRGCEHGCVYCFARPSHEFLGLSAGLEFETRLFAKPDAAAILRRELARPGYRCRPIAMGTNTDPYQPVERRLGITRAILELLSACGHPVSMVTKSHGVVRDLDVWSSLASRGLAQVYLSVTTLDRELARTMEPRAATPARRLDAVRALADAGVPVGVMIAPVIPALNDSELEPILEAAAAGATTAAKVLLRLPLGVKDLFRGWLDEHRPERAKHVMSLLRSMRGGRDNEPRLHARMRGTGPYAAMLDQRFRTACRRLGLNREKAVLDTSRFRPPAPEGQLSLL